MNKTCFTKIYFFFNEEINRHLRSPGTLTIFKYKRTSKTQTIHVRFLRATTPCHTLSYPDYPHAFIKL
jgi:hypothetical protein